MSLRTGKRPGPAQRAGDRTFRWDMVFPNCESEYLRLHAPPLPRARWRSGLGLSAEWQGQSLGPQGAAAQSRRRPVMPRPVDRAAKRSQ